MSVLKFNPKFLEEARHVMLIFFGLQGRLLFVQITDRDDNIVYEAETKLADTQPTTLLDGLYELFPDVFDELNICRPDITFFQFDGQRVVDGETTTILDCEPVLSNYENFGRMLYTFFSSPIRDGEELAAWPA
jgi:hypothetical protein